MGRRIQKSHACPKKRSFELRAAEESNARLQLPVSLQSPMSFLSDRSKILAAGVFNLMLSMGVARFAYTPLRPQMQEQAGLGLGEAGWLASINYVGYLSGALIASLVGDPVLRDRLYRAGMIVAVLTTAMMGVTTDPVLWSVSRYFAGLSTAAGTLLGTGLILNWLIVHDHRGELGIPFSGVG